AGTGPLLALAQRAAALRVEGVDAGLAAGGQHVGHLAAGVGPAGDRRRAAVLEVVRVGDHGEGALPVVGHGLQLTDRRLGHLRRLTRTTDSARGAGFGRFSDVVAGQGEQAVQDARAAGPDAVVLELVGDPGAQAADRAGGGERVGRVDVQVVVVDGRDRKSTRLNSSHVKISYAVFCLKKK